MMHGLSSILALTLAGTVTASQLNLFDHVMTQVHGVQHLMAAGLNEADSISPIKAVIDSQQLVILESK